VSENRHVIHLSIVLTISSDEVTRAHRSRQLILQAEIKSGPSFEVLTLPSLRSLEISNRHLGQGLSGDPFAFQQFLTRSGCSLNRFVFYDRNLEDRLYLRQISKMLLFSDFRYLFQKKTIESFTKQVNNGYHEIMLFLEELKLSTCTSNDGLLAQTAHASWTDLDAHKSHKSL
jgi:hypothetical protein